MEPLKQVGDICSDLAALAPQCEITCQIEGPIAVATDHAVRIALLTTELITNAVKHAGPGRIVARMSVSEQTRSITLTVQDEGPGLPDEFTMKGAQTLGMRIIGALAEQMGASLTAKSTHPGAEFVAEIPVEPYKH